MSKEMEDKVRVDEVQGALKKLTQTFKQAQ